MSFTLSSRVPAILGFVSLFAVTTVAVDNSARAAVLPVSAVKLLASKASPQRLSSAGTVIFTAAASGGTGSYEYRFLLRTGTGAYVPVGDTTTDYSSDNTWNWTPTVANSYAILVYARNQGSTAAYEKMAALSFSILVDPATTGVTLVPDLAAPQPANTTITFTAQASGGTGAYAYRFFVAKGTGAYVPVENGGTTGYSSANQFAWTPTASGVYKIMVYARTATSLAAYQSVKAITYPISTYLLCPEGEAVVGLTANGDVICSASEIVGTPGADGSSVLSGDTDPAPEVGIDGDFYINTTTTTMFGPKTAGDWGIGVSLVGPQGSPGLKGDQGLQGEQGLKGDKGDQGLPGLKGDKGDTGLAGTDGATVLNGTTDPSPEVGKDKDFYINIAASTIFGPKTVSGWGAGTSLVGLKGDKGDPGQTGPPGPSGAGFTWVEVTDTSRQAEPNTGYLANNASQVTITLPAALAIGDTVRVNGIGAGGWKIAQNVNQTIIAKYWPIPSETVNWTAREFNRNWIAVASSSDGTKLVAAVFSGYIYTSTDSGVTWTPRASSRYWTSVASSADGTKLVAASSGAGADDYIYTSTDSGVTWTPRAWLGYWQDVASSSDGTKLVAVTPSNGMVITSADSGVTWTISTSGWEYQTVASSSDGTKLVVMDKYRIWTSANSGATWTGQLSQRLWKSVASSSDGTKLAAVAWNDQVYTSSDSGVTWTARAWQDIWRSIASSSDGTKLIASTESNVYISTDSGVTWTVTRSGGNWGPVASSSDGTKLIVGTDGQIYTGTVDMVYRTNTTIGVNGAISGNQYDALELQYCGVDTFCVLSYMGSLTAK